MPVATIQMSAATGPRVPDPLEHGLQQLALAGEAQPRTLALTAHEQPVLFQVRTGPPHGDQRHEQLARQGSERRQARARRQGASAQS